MFETMRAALSRTSRQPPALTLVPEPATPPDWITLPKAVDPEPEEERLIREAIEEWLNSEDLP